VRRLAGLAELAVEAAHAGSDIIARARPEDRFSTKGRGDYVTETDVASERAIRSVLEPSGVPVVGEEEAGSGDAAAYWVVDPLDGTTNFLHGFVAVGVSVALVEASVPVVGVVRAPFLDRTWTASRGGGAWCGERRLRVSSRPVERAIVGTGFPFRRKENVPRYLSMFAGAFSRFEDLRRPGAAALDLAWVAEGVFDGFFELGLGPWDVAAGALLISEAGGVVTDWTGDEDGWLSSGDILAGPAHVHDELMVLAAAAEPHSR
jgi:myo-inositol-1(or 4)-monophosphatase